MEPDRPVKPLKIPVTYSAFPAHATALKIIAAEEGLSSSSAALQLVIHREMSRRFDRHWMRDIDDIATLWQLPT